MIIKRVKYIKRYRVHNNVVNNSVNNSACRRHVLRVLAMQPYRMIRVSKGIPEFTDDVHPRIVFRIASVCNGASSYDRSRPSCTKDAQGWNTRTDTSRAAHRHSRRHVAREYIKGHRAGVRERSSVVRTDWNLAAIIGQVPPPSLGT